MYQETDYELVRALTAFDFERARRRARAGRWLSRAIGRCNRLLSFEDVEQDRALSGHSHSDIEYVPLSRIVGTVGRKLDFNRDFYPVQDHTRGRWQNINGAMIAGVPLPPVELYKVGDSYFVKDGNHRVSVARYRGLAYIDAYVIDFNIHTHSGSEPCSCDDLRENARPALSDRIRHAVNQAQAILGRMGHLPETLLGRS
jgi:hypothetical protein